MYKINRVVQMTLSLQRIQQQQTLKAGFINLRRSAVAPKVINVGLTHCTKSPLYAVTKYGRFKLLVINIG